MDIRKVICCVFVLAFLAATISTAAVDVAEWDAFTVTEAPAKRFDGPFKCHATALYFVHHGGPLKVTLQLNSEADTGKLRKALGRFLDADEHFSYLIAGCTKEQLGQLSQP